MATYTLWNTLQQYKVIIPIIQRDYAQGRKDDRQIEQIRKGFIKKLFDHLISSVPLELDFIYGALHQDELELLDGQQRLTTLFLLHWYLANRTEEKLQKIAEFLGLPLIQVYLLAEHFTAEDFFNSKDLNEQLWLSIRKMQEDPQWAGYAPSSEEWEQTPINVRITLVSLYERESKRYLMAKAEVEVPGNNFTE